MAEIEQEGFLHAIEVVALEHFAAFFFATIVSVFITVYDEYGLFEIEKTSLDLDPGEYCSE